jgi:hypothetical protein
MDLGRCCPKRRIASEAPRRVARRCDHPIDAVHVYLDPQLVANVCEQVYEQETAHIELHDQSQADDRENPRRRGTDRS